MSMRRMQKKKRHLVNTVASHLYMKGFMKNYYLWTSHGERCYEGGKASTSHATVETENRNNNTRTIPIMSRKKNKMIQTWSTS